MLTIFFFVYVLGSQQVLITKVNSHVMLFNFQYILKNNRIVVRFPFELIVIQVNTITVQKTL